ncbi:hypothetical protein P872_00460 [Rhodonellum psychrophilum GCM71 = DSM 17998]|uniref:Uncharacterized protein n=1 Tax=Rhodonellum psychrophilum GCM71 = DSM 17998 TaxID=1123057 RepID=U5C737_9BACT|nr:hypothetical protein P872_00460 [Rhodonellum psychrophilum GCM71 = DSM 17998]
MDEVVELANRITIGIKTYFKSRGYFMGNERLDICISL